IRSAKIPETRDGCAARALSRTVRTVRDGGECDGHQGDPAFRDGEALSLGGAGSRGRPRRGRMTICSGKTEPRFKETIMNIQTMTLRGKEGYKSGVFETRA